MHPGYYAVLLLLLSCVQGGSTGYQGKGDKADLDNHAQQLNPNNPKYQGNKK
jgi:hypothetical protein